MLLKSSQRNGRPGSACSPVTHVLGARVVHFDDDKDVLEMGSDASRSKRKCSGLLEDNGHNVISDMPFPQKLRSGKRTYTVPDTVFHKDKTRPHI